MLLFMTAAIATATDEIPKHFVLGVGEPVAVAWGVCVPARHFWERETELLPAGTMVWLTISVVLATGDSDTALKEARDRNLDTG